MPASTPTAAQGAQGLAEAIDPAAFDGTLTDPQDCEERQRFAREAAARVTDLLAALRAQGKETGEPSEHPLRDGLSSVDQAAARPDPAGFDPGRGSADLDARLKAAGMYTVPEMMGVTPLTRRIVHAGMADLDFFGAWLDRRTAEYLRMKAPYELREKDKTDELYEWVCAHAAAFSEIRTNFRAAASCDRSPKGRDEGPARESAAPEGRMPEHQHPQDHPTPDRPEREGDGRC